MKNTKQIMEKISDPKYFFLQMYSLPWVFLAFFFKFHTFALMIAHRVWYSTGISIYKQCADICITCINGTHMKQHHVIR